MKNRLSKGFKKSLVRSFESRVKNYVNFFLGKVKSTHDLVLGFAKDTHRKLVLSFVLHVICFMCLVALSLILILS